MPDLMEVFGGHYMSPVPDPYSVYKRLRDESPVFPIEVPLGQQHFVSRYDDVMRVLRDAKLFSSSINARGLGMVMGRTIIEMDGKDHSRHRALISPYFAPKAMDSAMARRIQEVADQLVNNLSGRGCADLVREFTLTFPVRIIAQVIGIPVADYEQFQQWALDIIGLGDDPFKGMAAAQALVEHLRPIAELRKREPADDLLSHLVHAEIDGERLDDEEVFSFLRLLVPAGAETTYRLIGNTLFALLKHPEQLDEVHADRSLIDPALDESLRWEAPVCLAARNTTAPTEIAGFELPAGAGLLLGLASANRDERHYDDPGRFDIHRDADDHLSFGFGRHFCAGSHLAKLEARIALNTMFDQLRNLRLDPAEPCGVYGLAFRSPDRLPVLFDG